MTAGLPGTGIGGLFYFCLVVWMPFRELYLLASGRSSVARWKTIGFHWAQLGAILAAVWAEAYLVSDCIDYLMRTHTSMGYWLAHGGILHWPALKVTGEVAVLVSFGTMLSVCMFAYSVHLANKVGLLKPAAEL